ncbi:hypothetical protein [Fictibacillus barbaricus]|uniref:Septum formation initiator n=1 Tax=Fictibacillus barbaricus TaxID=182136 RepID=A0ABU1TYP0_9BACL|nr:hypothetical protein [Fictibacillus barbaricus]MDR7072333.1 hypothetical protein [Fictibacillus barbaricus]
MSKTAKTIIILGTLFLIYFVFNTINRENARKEKINAIDEHFKQSFKLEEELKDQYDDDFLISMNKAYYVVTVKNNKVVKTVKQ